MHEGSLEGKKAEDKSGGDCRGSHLAWVIKSWLIWLAMVCLNNCQ